MAYLSLKILFIQPTVINPVGICHSLKLLGWPEFTANVRLNMMTTQADIIIDIQLFLEAIF